MIVFALAHPVRIWNFTKIHPLLCILLKTDKWTQVNTVFLPQVTEVTRDRSCLVPVKQPEIKKTKHLHKNKPPFSVLNPLSVMCHPHMYRFSGYVVLVRLMSYNTTRCIWLRGRCVTHRGWQLTVYSWTTRRQNRSGVHLLAVSIRSRPHLFESAAHLCSLSPPLGISESISMVTSACVLTWLQLFGHVLPCDVRYEAFAILCHVQPCWSYSHRLIVINKLDTCSSVMAGSASDVLLRRLQSVLNAAVRLDFSARKFDHTTPLPYELHWLKVPERVKFRLFVLTYLCLKGTAPHYHPSSL